MQLTNSNYFSAEAGREYMSVSKFKAFKACEFSAYHQYVTGEYQRPVTDALLIGSYVDRHFSGGLDEWLVEHPEILKRDGTLKAGFVNAENMIKRIERDKLFMSCMQGEKQVILTPEINGVKWKCLPDFINLEAGICYDLKTAKDFELAWSDKLRKKVTFYENFNYFLQLAVYKYALKCEYDIDFSMAIAAVTKEKTPDIKILSFDNPECLERMDREMRDVLEYQPFILKIQSGEVPETELARCEICNHCKNTKVLKVFEEAVSL